MALTPVFDPLAIFRAAEVGLVLGPLEPTALTGGFAVLAAVGVRAVALAAQVAPIRSIKLAAVQALTLAKAGILRGSFASACGDWPSVGWRASGAPPKLECDNLREGASPLDREAGHKAPAYQAAEA